MALSVAGWGSGDDAHAVLGNIVAVVYPNKFCSQAYSEEAARRIVPNLFTDTEDVLCGGDPMGAAGTCNGDSGKFIRQIQLVYYFMEIKNQEEAECISTLPRSGSF